MYLRGLSKSTVTCSVQTSPEGETPEQSEARWPRTPNLDLRRKHGFSAEPVPVSAYVGSSKNLKDLKDLGEEEIHVLQQTSWRQGLP